MMLLLRIWNYLYYPIQQVMCRNHREETPLLHSDESGCVTIRFWGLLFPTSQWVVGPLILSGCRQLKSRWKMFLSAKTIRIRYLIYENLQNLQNMIFKEQHITSRLLQRIFFAHQRFYIIFMKIQCAMIVYFISLVTNSLEVFMQLSNNPQTTPMAINIDLIVVASSLMVSVKTCFLL